MSVHTFGLAARGGRLTSLFGFSQMLNLAAPYGPVSFQGAAAAPDVANAVAAVPKGSRTVVVGYSWGAANAIAVAQGLERGGIPLDLLFLLVPPAAVIPGNVRRCINHTINAGWFILPWWSSGNISAQSPKTEAFNYEYGSFLGMTHVTIQALPNVHNSFAAELKRLANA